ncbi:helix-turn-helix transcriptional regulator [Nocardia sp. NPDC004860]|uniref:helix-turn-helix domain-containing protein n=1 Tax=Nocardia sp. NPDC004860 TaxID=3154557 RepID=UPI0033B02F83
MTDDVCLMSRHFDGPRHSWRFDMDNPIIICSYCDETRDAISGTVIRPSSAAMDEFPGIKDPTSQDRLGLALAEQQVHLIIRLREIREARGLTVDQVAMIMKKAPALVARFETAGTNPTMSAIRAYAKAVGANFEITVTAWEDE